MLCGIVLYMNVVWYRSNEVLEFLKEFELRLHGYQVRYSSKLLDWGSSEGKQCEPEFFRIFVHVV